MVHICSCSNKLSMEALCGETCRHANQPRSRASSSSSQGTANFEIGMEICSIVSKKK